MVQIRGNATTGYAGNGTGPQHVGLPQPTLQRTSHRPWCTDCKRKHDADHLDDNGRCTRCAHAAVTRAEAEARRAERAEEIAALEKAAQAAVVQAARKNGGVVRRTHAAAKAPKAPKPAKQPKTAPRPQQHAVTAPKATPATTIGTTPVTAPVETKPAPVLDHGPQCGDTIQDLIRRAATHRDPLTRHVYDTAISALTALRLVLDTQTPGAVSTSTPAAVPGPTSAGLREGEAPARRPTTAPRPRVLDAVRDEVLGAYAAGDSARTVAARHGVSNPTVLEFLRSNGVTPRAAGRRITSTSTQPTGDTAA